MLVSVGLIEGGFAAAVGAFLVCGLMIVIAGLWRPLGRWVAAIPSPIANAMLAGVLLGLCLAPVKAVAEAPLLGLAIVVVWALVAKWQRLMAVPAAVLVAALGIAYTVDLPDGLLAEPLTEPVLITAEPVLPLPASASKSPLPFFIPAKTWEPGSASATLRLGPSWISRRPSSPW